MTAQDIADLQLKLQTAVRRHWKALLIEGILLLILGLAASDQREGRESALVVMM